MLVRFLRNWMPYNAGEVAGFAEAETARLVAPRLGGPIAELIVDVPAPVAGAPVLSEGPPGAGLGEPADASKPGRKGKARS